MGVGVLIGRSGNHSVATAPAAPPGDQSWRRGRNRNRGEQGHERRRRHRRQLERKSKPKKLKAEAESGKGAEEILHYAPGVKPPEPKVEVGDKCEEGTAGCKNGKFEGSFFE